MEMEPEGRSSKTSSPNKAKKCLLAFLVLSILVNVGLIIAVVIGFTRDRQVNHVKEAVCHVRPNPVLDATIKNDNPVQVTGRSA